jgi:hypothetical protein
VGHTLSGDCTIITSHIKEMSAPLESSVYALSNHYINVNAIVNSLSFRTLGVLIELYIYSTVIVQLEYSNGFKRLPVKSQVLASYSTTSRASY